MGDSVREGTNQVGTWIQKNRTKLEMAQRNMDLLGGRTSRGRRICGRSDGGEGGGRRRGTEDPEDRTYIKWFGVDQEELQEPVAKT